MPAGERILSHIPTATERSGSRVSIQAGFRPRLARRSFTGHRMPPRTTQKSHRPRVSDRTMVGTAWMPQPLRNECEPSTVGIFKSRWMTTTLLPIVIALHPKGAGCKESSLAAGGEVFSLDIPFYRTRKTWKREPKPKSKTRQTPAKPPLSGPWLSDPFGPFDYSGQNAPLCRNPGRTGHRKR